MSKIEELRDAYEAATPGEWGPANRWRDGQYGLRLQGNENYFDESELSVNEDVGNADFIALAHNLMPQLLEAVNALKEIEKVLSVHPDVGVGNAVVHYAYFQAHNSLEKLK